MAFSENIRKHIDQAKHFAQLSGNIFALRAESFAVLQALGVPQHYWLSRQEQRVLTDAFAANLAVIKQEGWFALDTTLADLRGDKKTAVEQNTKQVLLAKSAAFYEERYQKGGKNLKTPNLQTVSRALDAATFVYNVTARGETKQLGSVHTLTTCRRIIRQKAGNVLLRQAA